LIGISSGCSKVMWCGLKNQKQDQSSERSD
jgi:hypothetical protein